MTAANHWRGDALPHVRPGAGGPHDEINPTNIVANPGLIPVAHPPNLERLESTGTEDSDQAQRRLRERLQARDNRTLEVVRRGEQLTFQDWADSFMENYSKPPIRAQKTHEANERAMKHLRATFGSCCLVDVTADDVERSLRARLKKRARVKTKGGFRELGILKATTVHQEFRVLRRALNVAVRKKFCEPVFGRRISGIDSWAVPAALRDLVGAASARVSCARSFAQRGPDNHGDRIARVQRTRADEKGSSGPGKCCGLDS